MNRKTLYLLVGLLIIALAAVGVGYGLWFEDLKIHGEVTTGELDVELSLWDFELEGPWDGTGTYTPLEWFSDEYNVFVCDNDPFTTMPDCPEGKFEGINCEAKFVDADLADGPEGSAVDDGPEVISFEVTGMYPSYHCLIRFDIHSTGTVPVHLYAELFDTGGAADLIQEDFTCFTPPDGNGRGCTRTQGYWKTHSACFKDGEMRDTTWDAIGEDTLFDDKEISWCDLFWLPPSKGEEYGMDNAYIQLAHQYMAAALNVEAGAELPAGEVADAFNAAEAFFFGGGAFPELAAGILDDYNNGLKGVPHCDVAYNGGGGGGGGGYPPDLYQLHQGDKIWCDLELHFTNEAGLDEGETYEFQYEIRAYQWNENVLDTPLEWPYDWPLPLP